VLVAWTSKILVRAIDPTSHEFGLSNVFVGVFVVAILGNAAEHARAVSAALAFFFVTPAGPHRDPGVPLCRTPDPAVV
jgi:hypothetical protein